MIYLLLLFFSFMLTYFIKNYAIKNSLVAEVNERSSHNVPTPHGGGIAIAVTWFVGLLYLYFTDTINERLFYALLVGAIISIVSFFDDLYELSPKVRLIAQALVSGVGLYFLGGLKEIDFGLFIITNQVLTNGFAFLLIVWFINLYNFLDGINGYAGSEAVFLSLAGFILFGGGHFLVLASAVLGFLFWNFGNNAKIFMGDVGSTLLGYSVAVFTIYYANCDTKDFWVWIVLFSVFWVDATLTLFRRYKNNEKISYAHKKHFYQRLNQSGWSHLKVSVYLILLNFLLFLIIYFSQKILISFVISLFLIFLAISYIDIKKRF